MEEAHAVPVSQGKAAACALLLGIFYGCGVSELEIAENALQATAPIQFAAWKASVEAREAAVDSISETDRSALQLRHAAMSREIERVRIEVNQGLVTAEEKRDEKLRAAKEAQDHYYETWDARKGDLRFARSGHGVGIGNAARAAIAQAERAAKRAVAEFQRVEAEYEALADAAESGLVAAVTAAEAEFRASLTPGQQAALAAAEAERSAEEALADSAPEAWAALKARAAQLEIDDNRSVRWVELLGFLLLPVLSVIPGRIAQRKGRSFWAWWAYGTLLLFPLALIHALSLKSEHCPTCGAATGGQSVACRACGEALA